jgi:hypothetical protein
LLENSVTIEMTDGKINNGDPTVLLHRKGSTVNHTEGDIFALEYLVYDQAPEPKSRMT